MKRLIVLAAALMIAIPIVNSLGVVSDYLEGNTLEITEGQSKIFSIRLQNPTESEIAIVLNYDKAFMKAVDYKEVYVLPAKTSGYRVLFNVTAPGKPGMYAISYTVGEVEPSGGGGLPLRLKISKNLNLKVVEDPNKPKVSRSKDDFMAILLMMAMIAGILIVFLYRKSRRRHAKRYTNRKVNK